MARLSLAAIARAVRGEVILGSRPPERGAEHEVDGYSIDSRTAKPGELFFAIVGPRLDGHEFVKAAVAGGVVAAVVAKGGAAEYPEAPALVRVKDTTRALQDLGAHVRRARPLRVVGITGSAGKTTAKEMTAAVLGQRFPVLKSEGNLNNTYGLPLMLLRLKEDHEAAVLEMGMSYRGEIARLVEIADPDVGAILNVLRVHLEHFGTLQKIAAAKGELFQKMRRDAVAVFNADDRLVARLGRAFPGPKLPYGVVAKTARVRAEAIEVGPYERKAHARLGTQAAEAGIDLFIAVGPLSRLAADAARAAGGVHVRHFPDSEAAAAFVASDVRPGDLVLVKGSRAMKMERVVRALLPQDEANAPGDAGHAGGPA